MPQTIVVMEIKTCDLHAAHWGDPDVLATYDAPTTLGPWANMCEECWQSFRRTENLGTGCGQRIVYSQDWIDMMERDPDNYNYLWPLDMIRQLQTTA
jgi:hypothetical protein